MVELKNVSWVEKYRPNKVKNVISNHTEKIYKALEDPMSIQNYLFYSRIGGTGKTSTMKAIQKELGCDYLNINASEERSIEMIRTRVKDFMRSKSVNSNSKKMVMLDEGEALTRDAMMALKNMIEEYSDNVFFVITTNNIDKIPQPMQSRFNILHFTKPNKDQIRGYLSTICEDEKMQYNDDALQKLINLHYPSIRCMIQVLQDLKTQNKNVTIENITSIDDEWVKVWEDIKNKKYNKILKEVNENTLDIQSFVNWLFHYMVEYDDITKKIKIIQILRDMQYDFKIGVDESISFMAHAGRMMLVFK